MKRAERHHLKENELHTLARDLTGRFEEKRREALWGLFAVAAIGILAIGFFAWRERSQTQAATLLADAVAVKDARIGPPGTVEQGLRFITERERAQAALTKFKAAADAYPCTDAGIYARYQEAGTCMALGNPAQAATAYQQVIDSAGDGIYGADGAARSRRGAGARGAVRSGDQHVQGARAAQGRSAAGGRHPDAARGGPISDAGKRSRCAADLQAARRGIPANRPSAAMRARSSRT